MFVIIVSMLTAFSIYFVVFVRRPLAKRNSLPLVLKMLFENCMRNPTWKRSEVWIRKPESKTGEMKVVEILI